MQGRTRLLASVMTVLTSSVGLFATELIAQTEAPQSESQKVDKIFDFWNRQDQPGFAVVVTRDGQTVYQKVMGLACQEHAVAITPKTVLNASGLAMPITGMAVLMLEQQGKLALNDDIRKYIPELPDFGVPIEVRHLLYQTSGLWDWRSIIDLQGREKEEISLAQVLRILKTQKQLQFSPGSRFQRSFTNYDLLAETIKRVSGKPMSEWAWENIFKPLKMTRTLLRDDYRQVIENQAFSYNFTRADYLKGIDCLSMAGSHSLFTTIEDLGKWLANLATGQVGGAELIARAMQAGKLADGKSSGFGAGFYVASGARGTEVHQQGDWAGSEAVLYYYPEKKLGVAVLANWDYTPVDDYPKEIVDVFLPKAAETDKKPEPTKVKAPVKVKAEILDRYVGDYRVAPGNPVLNISRVGEQLMVGVGSAKYPLTALSANEFELAFASVKVTFQASPKGEVSELKIREGDDVETARRLVLVKPTPEQLAEHVGTYRNDELDLSYAIELRTDRLVLITAGQKEIPLTPDERDRFTSPSRIVPLLAFRRDTSGKVSEIFVDSESVRDIVFKKI